jgi:hypothetical protein
LSCALWLKNLYTGEDWLFELDKELGEDFLAHERSFIDVAT